MLMTHENIITLLDHVTIDASTVVCHFKCPETNNSIVSAVAFEPYDGKIVLTWKEILFHPIKSYNRYYHTPIVIYGKECKETIVLKAFKQVSNNFIWNQQKQKYICN
ncbi:hypothetical protein [Sulfurimonas sp. NWX79]